MHLPKQSPSVLRDACIILSASDRRVYRHGIYPAACTKCCGTCTGWRPWRKSCAPPCAGRPGWCGLRFLFYRACTKVCGKSVKTFVESCW